MTQPKLAEILDLVRRRVEREPLALPPETDGVRLMLVAIRLNRGEAAESILAQVLGDRGQAVVLNNRAAQSVQPPAMSHTIGGVGRAEKALLWGD